MTNGKIKETYTQYLKEYASREELEKTLGRTVTDEDLKERDKMVDMALAELSSKELYHKAWQWQNDNALDGDEENMWKEIHLKFGDVIDLAWGNFPGRVLVTDMNMDDICICEVQDLDEYHRDLYDKDVMALGISFDIDRALHFGIAAASFSDDEDACWSDAESDLLRICMLCIRVNVDRDDVVCDDKNTSVRNGSDKSYNEAFYKSEVAMLHGISEHLWHMECRDVRK